MHLRLLSAFTLLLVLVTACAQAAPVPETPAPLASGSGKMDPQAAGEIAAQAAVATLVESTLQAPSPTAQVSPTSTRIAPPTLAPVSTTAPESPDKSLSQSKPRYKLDVEFTYADRSGTVTEEIAYTNRSADALSELRLVVELFAYQDLFSCTGLWWQDGQKIENAGWENIQVRIPLPEPLLPGQSTGLKITYDFRLPSQSSLNSERPLPIGYTSRQANLVDWYPFIPPYRSGVGWLAYPTSYYGEHLVFDLADFEVNLRLADQRKDLVVAASAPARQDGEWLRYRMESVRSFALSIGHEYETESAQVGDITITSYYFYLNTHAGKTALQTTVEAVRLYQELFGPYPHSTLAVVEADFYDGMEYDGLFFVSRAFYNQHAVGQPGEYLVAITAHETAHQWWFALVGNDQANEPWLDEALCTYSERLYYERYYPAALDWWWYYRIDYDHPRGWVDSSVYNPQGALQTYQDYRNAVYLNGAHFFEDLREAIGDDAFFAFLKDYAEKYSGQIAFSADFFALLARHTRADITPVLKKYFSSKQ